MSNKDKTAEELVETFIASKEAFNTGRIELVKKIRENDKCYMGPTIDYISTIIFNSKKGGLQKFLALHLVKDSLDSKNPAVVDCVEKKLLTKLTKICEDLAKADGSKARAKVLNATGDDGVDNFMVLLLECIQEWSKMFGESNKAYKKSFESLAKKKVPFNADRRYFRPKASSSSSNTAAAVQQQQSGSRASDSKPQSNANKPAETKPQPSSNPPQRGGKSSGLVEKTEKLISEFGNLKQNLREIFTEQNEVDSSVIEYFHEHTKATSADLEKAAMELSAAQIAGSDPLIDRAFAETGLAGDITNAFQRYLKETKDLSLLKMELNGLLAEKKKGSEKKLAKDEPTKPPTDKKSTSSDQPKKSSKTKSDDDAAAREEKKSKEPRSGNTSFDKGPENKKAQAEKKSALSKDPFGAFNPTKKEGSANKDLFAEFTTPATGEQNKKGDGEFNFGAASWDAPNDEERKGSAHESKPNSGNEFGWGEEHAAPPKDQGEQSGANQGQTKGFGFEDFGDHFTEEDEKSKEKDKKKGKEKKKEPETAQDIFGRPKTKAERMQLQSKDAKEDGMIIVDDPNSFAGFNFGGPATQPGQREADVSQERSRYEENPEHEPVSQKRQPDRKVSDENVPRDAYETGDFGGPEQRGQQHEGQSGFYFEGEQTDTRQPTEKMRYDEHRRAEAEEHEEEKGGEQKGFGFGDFGETGQKKEREDGFGDFGFGKEGDDFGKEFFGGSDNFFGGFGGEKEEKKAEGQGGDFFSANAGFFSGFDQPVEESKAQKGRGRKESEESDLKPPKTTKGFSFQEGDPQPKSSDHGNEGFSPAFKGSWDNSHKKPEDEFNNWNLKPQRVPEPRGEDDDYWKDTKDSQSGAFDFSNQGRKAQAENQGGNFAIPKGLWKDTTAGDAINVLLTSHLKKNAQLESERARDERDKVYNDLESVKQMYAEMRNQMERMRKDQMQMSGNYGKVKEELMVQSQVNKNYGSEFKKLKNVAEEQKKMKNDLRQEAEQQLLKSQALNSEINQLKQQSTKTDSKERKEHIQVKINDLEKQLESNTNFLQTIGALLKASEQEDQDNIQKIGRLSEISKATPPRQRSPSPEDKARGLSPNKNADEVVRLKDYENPTMISAVTLLQASRKMREQDLKAFASGQMPKPSDTPVNLKVSVTPQVFPELKTSVRSNTGSPRKPEPPTYLSSSVVRDRYLNIEPVSGRTDWRPPSNLVSPNALSGIGLSLPKLTNNYVQSSTDDQPAYQFNFTPLNLTPQNLAPQNLTPQNIAPVQPTIDNPVLKQVSELLEKSKKIRFDNTKFSLRKDSEPLVQAPVGSTFGEKITSLTQTNVVSPTLTILDPNRGFQYQGHTISTTYTPSPYAFRKENPSFDFGAKNLAIPTLSETPKQFRSNFFGEYPPKPEVTGFISSSNPNEEPENSLTSALHRINLKSSVIHLKSSRFLNKTQSPKVQGQKAGRLVSYNSFVFDKLVREIEFNRNLKDADLFRYACLASKSALLDSPILQIGVISSLDRGMGSYSDPRVSIILHYGNKTAAEMSNFNVNTSGARDVRVSSEVYGFQIAAKFQLKQEFTQSFRDFSFSPASIEVSFA